MSFPDFVFFRDEYDWYFLATDNTYLEPTRIMHLVDHMSINRRLYMGKPVSYLDKMGEITYCNVSCLYALNFELIWLFVIKLVFLFGWLFIFPTYDT